MVRVASIAMVVAGTGCLSTPPPAQYDGSPDAPPIVIDAADCPVDADGDGYLHAACVSALPSDCEDDLGNRHPGAYDVCGDDIDQDCLGGDLPCGAAIAANSSSAGAGTLTIANGVVQMVVDDAEQAPIELRTGGDNLLYTGNDSLERLMGVQMYDDYFSWQPHTASRTLEADGRAVVRLRIDWASGDQPDPPSVTGLEGTSIYTFHPDGRIHRDESFAVRQDVSTVWLTGYVALDPLQFTHVDWTSNPDPPWELGEAFGSNMMARTEPEYICAYEAGAGQRIGWAWRPVSPPAGAGPRVTENFTVSYAQMALQYDFYFGGNPPDETSYAATFLMLFDQIGKGERCDAAPPRVAAYLDPPQVDVSAPAGAAVYDDGGGFYRIDSEAADVAFTLAGAQETLTVRIDGIDPDRDPTIELDGARLEHGRHYLYQSDTTGGWLYLAGPLPAATAITVRTP